MMFLKAHSLQEAGTNIRGSFISFPLSLLFLQIKVAEK